MGKMPISKKSLLNMALSHTLPIYIDTYKLILLIFERTSNFGREYKYTLGQDLKKDSMVLIFVFSVKA
jgi:hypothetical protein